MSLSCLWVPIGLQFLVSHLLAKVAKNYLLKKKKKEKKKKAKNLDSENVWLEESPVFQCSCSLMMYFLLISLNELISWFNFKKRKRKSSQQDLHSEQSTFFFLATLEIFTQLNFTLMHDSGYDIPFYSLGRITVPELFP